jgi:hypothetical protein
MDKAWLPKLGKATTSSIIEELFAFEQVMEGAHVLDAATQESQHGLGPEQLNNNEKYNCDADNEARFEN